MPMYHLTSSTTRWLSWLAALALSCCPLTGAQAEAEAETLAEDDQRANPERRHENAEPPVETLYVSLGPGFITNYDGGSRLKYLKTDVSIRTHIELEPVISHHLPYLRNRLVTLFSAQLEENLTSTQGREALRRQALEQMRDALRLLESEEHAAQVVDLFFTSFVVQR